MNPPKIRIALSVVILHLNQVQGAVVIDQQVGHSASSSIGIILRENGTAGQSFTPEFSSIQFITLNTLGNSLSFGPVEATLRIGLYLGEDRSMGVIASSSDLVLRSRWVEIPSDPFTIGYNIVDPLTWIFDLPVSVTPGSKYSFFVDHISGDDLDWVASLEPYAGGKGLFSIPELGFENQSYNFGFSEGILIPEPSTCLLIGLSVLVTTRRRRIEQGAAGQSSLAAPLLMSSVATTSTLRSTPAPADRVACS